MVSRVYPPNAKTRWFDASQNTIYYIHKIKEKKDDIVKSIVAEKTFLKLSRTS